MRWISNSEGVYFSIHVQGHYIPNWLLTPIYLLLHFCNMTFPLQRGRICPSLDLWQGMLTATSQKKKKNPTCSIAINDNTLNSEGTVNIFVSRPREQKYQRLVTSLCLTSPEYSSNTPALVWFYLFSVLLHSICKCFQIYIFLYIFHSETCTTLVK